MIDSLITVENDWQIQRETDSNPIPISRKEVGIPVTKKGKVATSPNPFTSQQSIYTYSQSKRASDQASAAAAAASGCRSIPTPRPALVLYPTVRWERGEPVRRVFRRASTTPLFRWGATTDGASDTTTGIAEKQRSQKPQNMCA